MKSPALAPRGIFHSPVTAAIVRLVTIGGNVDEILMAKILPFQALRYDTSVVRLEDVLTQPYDKITPEMQEGYLAASPHNLIHVELGRPSAADNAAANVYTRAVEHLKKLRVQKVLVSDPPSIYAYSQQFTDAIGTTRERKGFIALGHLHDYNEKVVFRHEQTLAKPKADRINLLRATRIHTGQIFMLYDDPSREVDKLVWRSVEGAAPVASMVDEFKVLHRIWRISDPTTILTVRDKMADKKLIIADGHHRYETGLSYRMECRADAIAKLMGSGRTGQLSVDPQSPYENGMMTFVNTEDEGLVILPTHRVVSDVNGFDRAAFLQKAADFFEVEQLIAGATAETMLNTLAAEAAKGTVFVAAFRDAAYLLRARPAEIAESLEGLTERHRALDVVQLHKVVLDRLLGIHEEAVKEQSHITYHRSAEEAVARVHTGANVAFLMNPVSVKQVKEIAFAGEVMPQKSTDFYPKLMSGMTMYALD